MTKKRIACYTLPPVALIALASLWMTYTHDGRVFGLYTFAAFKAPPEAKLSCARETSARVAEKFVQPLAFDESSKDALREYWHFSYYRECLFKAGYDFYGAPITPTELTLAGDTYQYQNHVAGIALKTPSPTTLIYDNVTNPDLDDYIIASQLLVQNESVMIHFDRSYKVTDTASLEPIFAGFESVKGFVNESLVQVPSPRPDILAYEDGNLFGYVIVIPNHHIVTLYGEVSARPVLESLISSLTLLP